MKKFVKTLAATLATVLVFGMTVSAAGSTSTSTTDSTQKQNVEDVQNLAKSGQTKGVDANGNVVDMKINFGTVEDQKSAQEFATANGLGTVLVEFDMTCSASNFTAILKVPGLKNNTEYTALHFKGGKWVSIATTNNNNGTVSFPVDSCSPFAIVEGKAAAAVVAPKTGEVIALAAILAIAMMAGAVVCARKARVQK